MKKNTQANLWLGILLSGVLAGLCIAIGGTVFLSVENKVIGASLFSIGLFFVVSFKLWLFTGRVGYLFQRDRAYPFHLLLTLLGNYIGTFCVAALLRQTRAADGLVERAAALSTVKLGDSPVSIFVLAIFCGILMYVGVHGFGSFEFPLGKYLSVYLAVAVFILSGFEHCVANMYYYSLAGVWANPKAWSTMLVMVLGNTVGSIVVAEGIRLSHRLQE